MTFGECLTAEECDQLLKMMDADGDKQVNVERIENIVVSVVVDAY